MHATRFLLVRLLLCGGLLVAGERALAGRRGPDAASRPVVRLSAAQVDELVRGFAAATGRSPDARERDALVAAAVDEEILHREALARRLDATDAVVQRRLVSNMAFVAGDGEAAGGEANGRLYRAALELGMEARDVVVRRRLIARMRALLEEPGVAAEPTEEELERALAEERARFVRPERVRISQIFVRRSAGDAGRARAAATRLLEAGLPDPTREPAAIARAGDPSPLPCDLPLQDEHDLARLFGASFARDALALPERRWSGPIASAYGEHVVWVHERAHAEPLPLDAVRGRLRELVRSRRAADALTGALAELRSRYEIVVGDERPDGSG